MKKDNPTLSIVICVYNAEKYIEKCLESIFKQTYKDYEIIIIEDCSTDKSKEKLKLIKKTEKINMHFNDKNRGAAYCRNIGVKEAKGKYIGFIDADDFIPANYYENMMETVENNKAEIVVCDIEVITDKNQRISCAINENDLTSRVNCSLAASPCNKVIKKEIIEKYPFSVGKVNEDVGVIIPLLIKVNKVVYDSNSVYYYVQQEKSVQNQKFSLKKFDLFHELNLVWKRIKGTDNYFQYRELIIYHQCIPLLLYGIINDDNKVERKEYLKQFRKYTKEYSISKNLYLRKFLKSINLFHSFYYRTIIFFLEHGNLNITNNIIALYQTLRKCKND